MSILLLPNKDLSLREIARLARLEGRVEKRVDTLELCGFVHSFLRVRDRRGKEAIVSTVTGTGDIEITVIEPEGYDENKS